MTYFCTKCQKYHADRYNKHRKYKKTPQVKDIQVPERTDNPALLKRIRKLEMNFRKQKRKINGILEILKIWGFYLDRKHPYWRKNKKFDELVKGLV